jgi:FtsP/CotA-like multicopper oxidase with cupredoxin domain
VSDNVIIRVKNDPGSPTAQACNASIHWHGIHLTEPADGQAFARLYDGTPLTQCPIPPGGEMTYSLKADKSHYKLSLLDGISGPFIAHDPVDPYFSQYDEERVVLISDFFLNETAESHFYNWKGVRECLLLPLPGELQPHLG